MTLDMLIVGGGPGGLAAAAFLRGNHNITVLERHLLDFTKDDHGISVMSNAYGLLQKAGIDEFKLDMALFSKIWVHTWQNQEVATQDFDTRKMFGAPSVLTKRNHIQRELYRLATSAELLGVQSFQTQARATRKLKQRPMISSPLRAGHLQVGADKQRILAYHTSPREIQFVGYAAEEEFASQFNETRTTIITGVPAARAQKAFSNFSEALTSVFAHHRAADGTVEIWRIRDIDPQDSWHRGKALLIGDAAHAVTPHAGQGANCAFEDAEALGFLLANAQTVEDIEPAISDFLKIRQPRAHELAMSSRTMGALLTPEEVIKRGDFHRVAFGDRMYRYQGAESALRALVSRNL